ncbi:MAG: hypothetical protein ACYS22_10770, partial [Planctomycetota bacterium]
PRQDRVSDRREREGGLSQRRVVGERARGAWTWVLAGSRIELGALCVGTVLLVSASVVADQATA